MPEIKGIKSYTIPMFGNKRVLPYGSLIVSDGSTKKVCPIKGDIYGEQHITFNHRRYYVVNVGTLYSPAYKIV